MIYRIFVIGLVLALAGGCRNRCCPCPPPCKPCEPAPQPPPEGDMNCATWNNPDCNGMSRPTMLNAIKVNAEAAHSLAVPTITDEQYESVIYHYNKYMQDKNCLGNINNGAGDCALPGVSNCSCLQYALGYSTGVGNWPACITRLIQGH